LPMKSTRQRAISHRSLVVISGGSFSVSAG